VVTARTAVLQVLRRGPGYGRLLMQRVREATGGRASLAPGSVYPALRALERDGLVRKWTLVAGRVRGGRARTYYELTVLGVRAAESEARALAALLGFGDAVACSPGDREVMRRRIERASEIFEFVAAARGALGRARRRA
jgi:PadR family transcriptional regulator, regulatory protein PadR